MARVKRAVNAHKKRRSILKASKGYRGQRSRLYRKAKEQQLHSLNYAYRDRRARKGEFRKLWISRINAAARANDITYNRLIQGLKAAGVEVDRKNLADIAITDPAAFTALVDVARAALPEDVNAPVRRGCLAAPATVGAHRTFGPGGRGGQIASPRRPPAGETIPRRRPQPGRGRVGARAGPRCLRHRVARAAARVFCLGAQQLSGPPGHRACRKSAVRHRHPGGAGGRLRNAGDPAGRTCWPASPRLIAVAVEISEPGNAGTRHPHRRRHGRRGGDPRRAQRRPVQRQVPARLGRQHLLDSGRRRARHRRRAHRAARRRAAGAGHHGGRRDAPRRGRGSCSAGRRRGCSGPNHTVCQPKSRKQADHRVRIPMSGGAESLNVACRRGDLSLPERAGSGCARVQAALRSPSAPPGGAQSGQRQRAVHQRAGAFHERFRRIKSRLGRGGK